MKKYLFFILSILISTGIFAEEKEKKSDKIEQTDHFGFTAMGYYNYANWISGKNKASIKFESFRIWAQTNLSSKLYAKIQYRFYEGWRTPTYFLIGWNINKHNTLRFGQTWAPFGFRYQPFDDWGNLAYYIGLQDDSDMGITWEGNYGIFTFHAGFFKNQQLSSSSPMRYDADIFSGDTSPDYLFPVAKHNKEVNQFNGRIQINPTGDNWSFVAGISGMWGQIYNKDTDEYGNRLAAAVHLGFDISKFHINFQGTWYDYTQKLPDTATADMYNFLNVSSWNFAYEIPSKAGIYTASADFDVIGDKLSIYANYSLVTGGTTEANSQLITAGISTVWRLFQVYGEVHNGINDPQLSGNATGYGRDAGSYDIGFQIRCYYTMSILNEKTIKTIRDKLSKKSVDKKEAEKSED